MRQISADRGWSTMQVYVSAEQIFAFQFNAMRNTDIGGKAPRSRGFNCLRHRLCGANTLKNRVSPYTFCYLFDPLDTFVTALGHNVSCAKFACEILPRLVTTHRYYSLSPHLLCRKNTK